MPVPTNYYPPGWRQFSDAIRFARAGGRCECTGTCGLHQPTHHIRRCLETHHTPAQFAKGKIVLTVAHLCACSPICLIPSHVIAACQRCHLRIDRGKHAASRKAHAAAQK